MLAVCLASRRGSSSCWETVCWASLNCFELKRTSLQSPFSQICWVLARKCFWRALMILSCVSFYCRYYNASNHIYSLSSYLAWNWGLNQTHDCWPLPKNMEFARKIDHKKMESHLFWIFEEDSDYRMPVTKPWGKSARQNRHISLTTSPKLSSLLVSTPIFLPQFCWWKPLEKSRKHHQKERRRIWFMEFSKRFHWLKLVAFAHEFSLHSGIHTAAPASGLEAPEPSNERRICRMNGLLFETAGGHFQNTKKDHARCRVAYRLLKRFFLSSNHHSKHGSRSLDSWTPELTFECLRPTPFETIPKLHKQTPRATPPTTDTHSA